MRALQGKEMSRVYLVLSGTLAVTAADARAHPAHLLGPGCVLGENALNPARDEPARWPFTATSRSPARLAYIGEYFLIRDADRNSKQGMTRSVSLDPGLRIL